MPFPDSASAHELLDGLSGIEIGGSANNPFNIPGCIYVDYTDDMTTVFKQSELSVGDALGVDVVAPGDNLPFADDSLEYVLTSHVLEHFWDPIGAIKEWLRVLKPGGLIYMIVPHKERTFDAERPRTSLVELIRRHRGQFTLPPDDNAHGHHSVWITADIVEVVTYLGLEVVNIQDTDDKVGNGFTVVVRKAGIPLMPALGLDLGCGLNKRARTIGIDKHSGPGVDVALDLSTGRLPFDDDSIPAVYSNGLFEFIDDPTHLLTELIRVCRRNATIEIWTRHAASDDAMFDHARQRFTEATWLDLLAKKRFADADGTLTLKEIRSLVPTATLQALQAQAVPVDYAIRHYRNVVSTIGAFFVVRKSKKISTTQYLRRVVAIS